MNRTIHRFLLAVTAFTALATPALAETVCRVTAAEINLRKTASMRGRVLQVLKKGTEVTADSCSGGWVKVTAAKGGISGYVGGWALSGNQTEATPAAHAAAVPALPVRQVAIAESPSPIVTEEIPTNEQLAVQITELRLSILGLSRDLKSIKRDIRRMKVGKSS
ncbi:SH3 domain-containing protein [Geomonas sp. Red32]|uniref:SH3 domain-containing protein n=1 Tax=Geomonas sp. Red32 TaxID=2912856 RepID=UPI00202CE30A|nr:SH3 domain-containing protein [Geomonas sp. Red32]MCM0084165.1 SH3 domain-containing protein [Geomonas sp. Red32]